MQGALQVLAVALVVVAFPLLARYAGSRHRPRVPSEDAYGFRVRHALSASESAQVERAVRSGRRLDEPALRPLVVERASALLELTRWWPTREHLRRPRTRRATLALLLAGLTGGLCLLWLAKRTIADDDWSWVPSAAVTLVYLLPLGLWRGRVERSRRRNADEGDAEQRPPG